MNQEFGKIDQKKIKLLNEFIALAGQTKGDEILPLLLAFKDKAVSEKISFTKEDMNCIFENIKETLSPSEREKAETMVKMLNIL